MRAAGILYSLKDLSDKIENCERYLSQTMKCKESNSSRRNSSSVTDNHRLTNSHQTHGTQKSSCCQRKTNGDCFQNDFETPSRLMPGRSKSILCKETITDKSGATQVQVVVQTKPLKRRSRSLQSSKANVPTDGVISQSCDKNVSTAQGKNPSWSHIFQKQTHVSSTKTLNRKALSSHLDSKSDGFQNAHLDSWFQSVPETSKKLSKKVVSENLKSSGKMDRQPSTFDPLRILNFLIKELRGKVNENHDEHMLRIVEDMEDAIFNIPTEHRHSSSTIQPTSLRDAESAHSDYRKTPVRPTSSLSENRHKLFNRKPVSKPKSQVETETVGIPCEEDINSLSTSPDKRGFKLSSMADTASAKTGLQGELLKRNSPKYLNPGFCLQSECDTKYKQLEETCETLREQYQQAIQEIKRKSGQIEAISGKNHQLTLYSADVRQELLRAQQAAKIAQQEQSSLKMHLLKHQQDNQNTVSLLNKRIEEALRENERLSTELHMCQLEREKVQILLSSKDLEVTKLKKEIVEISAIVSEQLANLCAVSKPNKDLIQLNEMMRKIGSFCENTEDSVNFTDKVNSHDSVLKGEGNRSHFVCSSPTSTISSSLYNSWHLSDISETTNKYRKHVRSHEEQNTSSTKSPHDVIPMDGGYYPAISPEKGVIKDNQSQKLDDLKPWSKKNPADLKAELRNVFHILKERAAEAVNVTLDIPSKKCSKSSESVENSHWTELSASESTLLHSSDDSQSD